MLSFGALAALWNLFWIFPLDFSGFLVINIFWYFYKAAEKAKNMQNGSVLPGIFQETPDFDWFWRTDFPLPEKSCPPDFVEQELNVCPSVARALSWKGFNRERVMALKNPEDSDQVFQRVLQDCPGFRKNFETLRDLLIAECCPVQGKGKRLGVLTDFDVDGATSAASICLAARMSGWRPVLVNTPNRRLDGHGPARGHFDTMSSMGAEVFLVTDCGSAHGPLFRDILGIHRVLGVVDHHDVGEVDWRKDYGIENGLKMPILLNPWGLDFAAHPMSQEARSLSAGALSGFLAKAFMSKPTTEVAQKQISVLSSFSTVCDVMEISPECKINRALVREGLAAANDSGKKFVPLAMRKIAEKIGKSHILWDSEFYGWSLGPIFNSGSRMGWPNYAVEALTGDYSLVDKLLFLNNSRKERSFQIKLEAEQIWLGLCETEGDFVSPVIHMPGCPVGLAGLAAGYLSEISGEPSFVLGETRGKDRISYGGSARSCRNGDGETMVDIGAIVREGVEKGELISGGGHAAAAGFEISMLNRDQALQWLRDQIKDSLSGVKTETIRVHMVDAELYHSCCRPESLAEIVISQKAWNLGDRVSKSRFLAFAMFKLLQFAILRIGDMFLENFLETGFDLSFQGFFCNPESILAEVGAKIDVCGAIVMDLGYRNRPASPAIQIVDAKRAEIQGSASG